MNIWASVDLSVFYIPQKLQPDTGSGSELRTFEDQYLRSEKELKHLKILIATMVYFGLSVSYVWRSNQIATCLKVGCLIVSTYWEKLILKGGALIKHVLFVTNLHFPKQDVLSIFRFQLVLSAAKNFSCYMLWFVNYEFLKVRVQLSKTVHFATNILESLCLTLFANFRLAKTVSFRK